MDISQLRVLILEDDEAHSTAINRALRNANTRLEIKIQRIWQNFANCCAHCPACNRFWNGHNYGK